MIERKGKLVSRNFSEVSTDNDGVLIGTPIVYGRPANIANLFEEVIERGAVQPGAITKDTALYYNHDTTTKPLCRVRTGKLKLEESDTGIQMEARLNLERSDCKDLYLAVKDGDINKMSFCFRVEDDDWDFETNPDMPRRTVKKISYIKEVSAVDNPAYEDTALYARKGEPVETDSEALENARALYIRSKEEANVIAEPEDKEQSGVTDSDEPKAEEGTALANGDNEENREGSDTDELELAKIKALVLLSM